MRLIVVPKLPLRAAAFPLRPRLSPLTEQFVASSCRFFLNVSREAKRSTLWLLAMELNAERWNGQADVIRRRV
jgi:hypothetical protein